MAMMMMMMMMMIMMATMMVMIRLHTTAGTRAQKRPLLFVAYADLTPIRRLPPIEDAPGPTACAAADVHVVSSHVTQATVFRLHRNSPVSHFRSTSNCPKGRCREERCAAS